MGILDPNKEILIITGLDNASLDQVGMDLLYPLLFGKRERFLTLGLALKLALKLALGLTLRLTLGLALGLNLSLDLGLSVVLFRWRETQVNSMGNAQSFQPLRQFIDSKLINTRRVDDCLATGYRLPKIIYLRNITMIVWRELDAFEHIIECVLHRILVDLLQ